MTLTAQHTLNELIRELAEQEAQAHAALEALKALAHPGTKATPAKAYSGPLSSRAAALITQAGRPLATREIMEGLARAGGRLPTRATLYSMLRQHKAFTKVAPGTWATRDREPTAKAG